MTRKPMRPCNFPLCSELTAGNYCQTHQQQTVRLYDKARDPKLVSFYKSSSWLSTRQAVLSRDNHLCQHCLQEQRLTPAVMVHHIQEVRKDWEVRLDLDNLISLCDACHNKVHN
ncbi:electron transporter [Paenibacillus mucilaginosus 3016]|uniref:Putative HNH nuclease YajD n=1 Tax=Paenibacillus mucilaginosus 3016 TaxID=1116391 RepID=H6NGU2_9BACL|nr:HNH endonuclease signature motif containing protein [Paenibacillus mucilaginosus]AFC28384.1 electron transporter [Paenibacillus mucilaginosus 3016]WFA17184.1 HNH endonuclease [Paenibacillus mucilaginosus]